MIPAVVISKKRDRLELSTDEIRFMVSGFATGSIPDYQMSALAMAIFINGMNDREIADLTDAMIDSGSRMRPVGDKPRVDKHSTGGLGDKTSLILAPLLACVGLDVPMISGRGLGITGGTLDKLEAIPGFRCNLNETEIEKQLREIGCVITGATDTLVPADKKLYALRDVTGTVPSIALITASIMSKKIAESLDALVLDVKFGTGAFLGTNELAEQLASSLIRIGKRANVSTSALITDMNQPLGEMVGNACEVNESIDVLQGAGPIEVRDLTVELAAYLMVSTRIASSLDDARKLLFARLDDGSAMERFERMVSAQGGSLSAPRPLGRVREINATGEGNVSYIDGQLLGQAVIAMGGGRKVAGQAIDFSVGMAMQCKLGDKVAAGTPLVLLHCDDDANAVTAEKLVREAIQITNQPAKTYPLWREYA